MTRVAHGSHVSRAAARARRPARGRAPAGLRRVELVGPEGADGTVTRAAAHDLDPDLAGLAVGHVRHELPGRRRAGACPRPARGRPGAGRPSGWCGGAQPRAWTGTRAASRPFYLLGRMAGTSTRPPYPEGMALDPPAHPQPLQGQRLHQLPARLSLLADRAPARTTVAPRGQGHPGARRARGPLLAPPPGAGRPAAATAELERCWRELQDDEEFVELALDARRPRTLPRRRADARRQLLPPGGPERGPSGRGRARGRDLVEACGSAASSTGSTSRPTAA